MPDKEGQSFSPASLLRWWRALPVRNGWLALGLLNLAVFMAGLESVYVQTATTYQVFSFHLLEETSFWLLFSLDILVPLTIALISRRVFMACLIGQCILNTVLLHYTIFFYNPLTLSTIYHSMQGAASLGVDILGFARLDIIVVMAALCAVKLTLVQLARTPDLKMPRIWALRGITAVCCMSVVWGISMLIYGQTGLSLLWVDSRGHRTATERRMEAGTDEAVRTIGYVATWIGEWMSGTYKDTELIYAESRCPDPDEHADGIFELLRPEGTRGVWDNLPLPPVGETVVLLQVESLDFAALSMKVNGHTVLPFIDLLAQESLALKVFAPHKVGSCNSDYEILNRRNADQNVIYYSYIKEYPDSVIHQLAEKQYRPFVFHGLGGNLFNLRNAYTAQGFEGFYFKEDLLAAGYAPSAYIMEHVADEDVFDMAASQMSLGGRRAQFIITMSSHIPFMEPLPIFKSAGGAFARYVSSLRYLDQSLAAYYAQLPLGTLLILWGDHGSDVEYPLGFPENRRHVPFLVHVKGDASWLQAAGKTGTGRNCPVTGPGGLSGELLSMLLPVGKEETPRLASTRVYTLCELAWFLNRIFR